jgi:hypothetical protein
VETANIRTEQFHWTTSFNLTLPKNELVAFPGLESSAYAGQYIIGEPLSVSKLYTLKGVNPETGLYDFVDQDGDGTARGEMDRTFVYNFGRKYYGGINNTIAFKGIELSFLLQFINQRSQNFAPVLPGQGANQSVDVLNRWQNSGDVTSTQRFSQVYFGPPQDSYFLFANSNGSIANSSFLRMKTLSLAYTFSSSLLQNTKLQSARIYVQGQNLFTGTDFAGLDPETGSRLPPLQMFTVGIQVKI